MIKTETVTIGEQQFIRTYSDKGMYIHGGNPESDYVEAIDPIDSGRTYSETDTPIDNEATAEEIVDILTGESA